MPAFNYRDLIRLVPPRSWHYYFQARGLALPEGTDWTQEAACLHQPIQQALEALPERQQSAVLLELRRVKALANARGIQALCNAVPMGDAMLDDFERHASDAERALWAMVNWPQCFDCAEAFVRADAAVGGQSWRRYHLPGSQVLHCQTEDINALRLALAQAFTPHKGRARACEIDVLTRHLDGGVQLDIRIEDNLQRSLEFGPDDCTIWRDVRPPLTMTAILYPRNGVIDLLVPGGNVARKKLLAPLGQYVYRQPIVPIAVPQAMLLLNRLRQGVWPDEHSGLDLRDFHVAKARLSECRVSATQTPACDYIIKPPGDKDSPDALECLRTKKTDVLMSQGFDIIDAVISLYFEPADGAKPRRVQHIRVRPTGIANLRELEEAEVELAQALLRALGVMQDAPTAVPIEADSEAA